MINNLDLLSVASWLGILVIAVQYYINNFLQPEIWKRIDEEVQDPIQRDNRRKGFKRKRDVVIFALLGIAVLLGLIGIIAKVVN